MDSNRRDTTNSITVTVGAGTGNITVTPSNACGNGTAQTLAVTNTTIPVQPSTITGAVSPCVGSSQAYSVTNVAGVTYNWTFPAGWTQTGGTTTNSITVTVGAGTGNITVTPSNACGNGTAQTLAVTNTTVPAQPSTITGAASPCVGSSQAYSVTNVAGVTYNWTFPAGWTQTGGTTTNSITVTVGAGTGNITVTPSNACGNGTAQTLAVTNTTVPAQPSTITGVTSPCVGSSQAYSVTNVAGVTYNWTFPAGWTQTGGTTTNSITVTVGAGAGNITVTPSNACGNGTARTLAVTNTTVPAQPSTITGAASPCVGSSQAYSVTNVAGVTYNWTFPAGWTQTGGTTTNSITVTVGAGTGNITVTPSNACGNGTARTLAVTNTTVPAQPSAITGATSPCVGSSQAYSVTNVAGVTYTWVLPAGWTKTAGGTTNSITVTVGAATGNITVTPSNACGNGTAQTLAVTNTAVPAQPSTITGATSPCVGSSQAYSVTNVAGVTYNWTFPAGWTQTGGTTTNSITVTVGAGTGSITVTPSNACGNGTARTLAVTNTTVPAQPSTITGATSPCIGSSQAYSVTNVAGVTYNWTFPAGWTQTAGGTTNSITVTVGAGTGNISVTPSNACGNGTPRNLAVTNTTVPAQPSAITGAATPCVGSSQVYNVTNVAGITYTWVLPAGWTKTAGGTTNSITVTVGANAGTISVTPSNACGNGTARTLAVTPNAPPTAGAITGANTVCIGATITLTPNPTGTAPFTYTWNSSTPARATVNNAGVVTGVSVGTTNITYTVTDANGCSATSANFLVTITKPTAGNITQASGITTICANGTLQLTSNGSGTAPLSYTWASSDNTKATVSNTGLVTGVAPGTVNITYTVTDGNGCSTTSAPYAVTLNAIPTGAFTATETSGMANNDNTICAGASVIFTAPSGYGAYTFKVNGVVVQGPNTNNIYNTSSLTNGQSVTVDVANASNCGTIFGPITITVNPLPTPTLVANNNPICAGDNVTFTATGGRNYNFKVNGSSVQSGASATYSTTALTNGQSVTVDVTNANGCVGTSSPVLMAVNALPAGTLSSSPSPASVCAGDNNFYSNRRHIIPV